MTGIWSFNSQAFWLCSIWFGLPGGVVQSWWLLCTNYSGEVENHGMMDCINIYIFLILFCVCEELCLELMSRYLFSFYPVMVEIPYFCSFANKYIQLNGIFMICYYATNAYSKILQITQVFYVFVYVLCQLSLWWFCFKNAFARLLEVMVQSGGF